MNEGVIIGELPLYWLMSFVEKAFEKEIEKYGLDLTVSIILLSSFKTN